MLTQTEGGVCAPKGFRANGVHCGIRKNKTKKDLALIVADVRCATACVYTTNLVKGAPILVTRQNVADGYAQAVICNSGNANTCNADGVEIAEKMCELVREYTGIPAGDVVVASTGVIGQKLSVEPIAAGMPALCEGLGDHSTAAAEAIMTTDTVAKEIAFSFPLGGKECRIGAICKGVGMICPNMATMLMFVTTDVAISPAMLQKALSADVKKSLNMVSVDRDTSTNDTLCVMASGLAGNAEITEANADYRAFCRALNAVTTAMCRKIARDGEGNLICNNIFACQIRAQLEATRQEEHLSFTFTNNIIYFDRGDLAGVNWKGANMVSDHNCYWDTRSTDLSFQGVSLAEWRAAGKDVHSVVADPGFVDAAHFDFRLKNRRVARKIGFEPFDTTQAGVYGSEAWRERARLDPSLEEAFDRVRFLSPGARLRRFRNCFEDYMLDELGRVGDVSLFDFSLPEADLLCKAKFDVAGAFRCLVSSPEFGMLLRLPRSNFIHRNEEYEFYCDGVRIWFDPGLRWQEPGCRCSLRIQYSPFEEEICRMTADLFAWYSRERFQAENTISFFIARDGEEWRVFSFHGSAESAEELMRGSIALMKRKIRPGNVVVLSDFPEIGLEDVCCECRYSRICPLLREL